jgi:hypothetical protein
LTPFVYVCGTTELLRQNVAGSQPVAQLVEGMTDYYVLEFREFDQVPVVLNEPSGCRSLEGWVLG